MSALLDLVTVPLSYGFMQRALVVAVLVGAVCAVLSCFLVLKGWSLMGDAVSHAVLPGIVIAFMLSGVQAQVVLKIFGEDLDALRSSAERLRARLQSVPGLVDLQVEKQVLIPQLKVTPDYERSALYGVTPAALTEALESLSSGRVVSQIVEGNRRFDVVMPEACFQHDPCRRPSTCARAVSS